jgi:hypothetical protein|tara:strand:- start:113 stop:559 length:447 start_codon:yes stop_codon:yes gene_type:complete
MNHKDKKYKLMEWSLIGLIVSFMLILMTSCGTYTQAPKNTIKVLAVTHEGDTIQLDVNSLRPRVYQNIYHTYPYYYNYWRPSSYYWSAPYYYNTRPNVNYTIPSVSKPYKPTQNAMPPPPTGSGPNTSSPNLATPPSTSTTTIKKKNR